jgi:hypothetical protein
VSQQRIVIDTRPAGVDHLFRPGSPFTITFQFYDDEEQITLSDISGSTFTSTLGDEALIIVDVDVPTATVTVAATGTETDGMTSPQPWALLVDGVERLVGKWVPSDEPRGLA